MTRQLLPVLLSILVLQAQPVTDAVLKSLRFREIGPAIMGGRIDDFAVVESDPRIVYAATASAGIFKTTNNGVTWTPIFENEATSTIGDIALAPSDPSILYVGSGEANNRQSSSWGNGMYRSNDAGKTWRNIGLKDTHHIGRVVVHPTNPDVVYVAALGHLWGPNKERGVFKSTDGGKTWTNPLFINEDTGITDIAMDHESPNTLYAAAYQRRRAVWGFNGGGPHSAIYKTTDGGATWKKLTQGLPSGGDTGRIGLAIYRKDSRIVYALVQHANGGLFRSEDKGETWTRMSSTNPRPMYYSQVHIDPNNDQRIWVHGASMYYSEDGGRTFRDNMVQRIHGDHHAMWINPANSDHIWLGSDGGIHLSYDRGRSWDFINTIPLGQFYEIGLDMQKPYRICGGLQDNNSWCGPSATLYTRGISNDEWVQVGGGDGFYAQIDPTDPNTVYAESQDGNLLRRDMRTGESKSIRPLEAKDTDPRYRFQWNSPIVISPHNPKTIYYGGNVIFKSTDRGDNWKAISPDLTDNADRNQLPIMGVVPGPRTLSRHDGVQNFPASTTVAESALRPGVVWVGTDDGNLHVSKDGETFQNVIANVPGLPKGTYVSRVVASKSAEGAAYATFDGHRANDFGIYIYKTMDFGQTWRKITAGIPEDAGSFHVIREHPRTPSLLFAGSEFGLWVSFNAGEHWQRLKLNLPTMPIDDIAIHPRDNDLVLGTHARSIWVLDDITPLEQIASKTSADLHLFDPRLATAWRLYTHKASTGHKEFIAPNPPYGVILNYWVNPAKAAAPAEPSSAPPAAPQRKAGGGRRGGADAASIPAGQGVTITILDAAGKRVRQFSGPAEAGLNRIAWDLRWDRPVAPTPEESAAEERGAGFGFGARGPRVEPGEYTVQIAYQGKTVTAKAAVEEDPRVQMSPADRELRFRTIMEVADLTRQADQTRGQFTRMRASVTRVADALRASGNAPELRTAIDGLTAKMRVLQKHFEAPERPLGDAGPPLEQTAPPVLQRLTRLLNALDSFSAAPSQAQLAELARSKSALAEAKSALEKFRAEELPKVNRLIAESGVMKVE